MTTPSATAPAGQGHTATPWELSNSGLMVVAEGRIPAIADCRMANGHANAAHIVHCVNTHSQLLAQNAALRAAIDSALEYFEDREDVVDGSYGESAPNKEMALAQELRTAIGVSP